MTGPAELPENGVNGFLVPMGDEVCYVKQCKRLLADEGHRDLCSEQARESVREFSHETVLAKFEELILGTNR